MLVGCGLPVLRVILGEIRLRLTQRGFERTRIDREQQVALLDVLPLAEVHLHDLPADLRLHINRRESLDPANGANRIGDSLLLHLGREDRHRLALAERIGGTMRASRNRNQCDRRNESCRAPSFQGEIALQLPLVDNCAAGRVLRLAKVASRILSGPRNLRKTRISTKTALPVSFFLFRKALPESYVTLPKSEQGDAPAAGKSCRFRFAAHD